LADGARQTLERRGAWRESAGDEVYQARVDEAMSVGVEPVEL
jgi:hypothetical protein